MGKFKTLVGFLAFLILFGYIGYKVFRREATNHLLRRDAMYTRGVIIDVRNYVGNSPVSHEYSYSYEIVVGGKTYTGDSHDPSLRVGDSLDVQYVKGSPWMNKPLHPTD
jgi:hypothetical protein